MIRDGTETKEVRQNGRKPLIDSGWAVPRQVFVVPAVSDTNNLT
jgi:hypothetical protein